MNQKQFEIDFLNDTLDRYFDLPLYFKCKGLFAEPFVGDHLLIDGKPSRTGNKFIDNFWDSNELEFEKFFNQINNIFDKYHPHCTSWNEYQLEDKFIKPILEALGFAFDVQETISHSGKRNRPDYTLFLNDSEYLQAIKSKTRDEEKYWSKAISVADAKAWSIDLDKDGGVQDCPSSQIVRYLDATVKDWGIITNGRQWRLYYRNCQDRSLKYFEIDLERICLSKFRYERLKYFFYFFRSNAFEKINGTCFLDQVLKESDSYAVTISNNLRNKIMRQAPLLTESLLKDSSVDLSTDEAFKFSLYYCFRLIFILSAESRGILDISLNSKYHNNSLRKIAYDLRENWSQGEDGKKNSHQTYDKLKQLFKILDQGDEDLGLVGFKSNSYANCDKAVFNKIQINDSVINELIMDMSFDMEKNGKKLFVDFKRIAPEHLGGIFETLLEFKPNLTKNGKVILDSDSGRKDSGSYYTPDYIVDYLVDRSIKTHSNPQNIKVLDPACGSGHFVAGAIRAISQKIASESDSKSQDLEQIRSDVAERCVFGLDRNEIAVALTKLSIYLSVMRRDFPLPKIDNNIVCTDSLRNTDHLNWKYKFDLVVGNPPYVNTKILSKSDPELKEYLVSEKFYETCKGCFDLYIPFIEKSLKHFLKKGGVVSFVLPNKLMVADYAEESRNLAENVCESIEVVDISHLDVFKGVGVYPHMYIFNTNKTESPSVHFTMETASAVVIGNSYAYFKTNQINSELKIASGSVWSAQKKKRKGLVKLSEFCVVEGGVTGYQAQEVLLTLVDGKKKTNSGHVPFVVSGNIGKAKISFGKVRYMKHDFNEPFLNTKAKQITSGKRNLFINEKIVIAGMTKEIRATHSSESLAVGVGVFSIVKSSVDFEAVTAILNSLAFTFLYREKFEAKHLAGGYLAINASQLKDADFPSDISKSDIKSLKDWNKKLSKKSLLLKDRIDYEKFVAGILGVTTKEIASLKVFDTDSREVIEAFGGAKKVA